MRKCIYFILLLMLCGSCKFLRTTWWGSPLFKNFSYRYEHPYPHLDTILNVDGYYLAKCGSACFRAIMLYRDGTIATYGYRWDDADNLEWKYQQFRTCLSDSTNHNIKSNMNWGRYYIVQDTIKAQFVLLDGWVELFPYEKVYLIKDRNTLVLIQSIDFLDRKLYNRTAEERYELERRNDTLRFVSFPERIDSAAWIKEERWFNSGKKMPI